MRREIQSRLNDFRTEIRRKHIQKTRNVFRRVAELDLTTICEIATMFGLPSKQEPNKYTFEELLTERKESLEKPPLGQMPQEHQHVVMFPIQIHIRFWKLYSECLNNEDNPSVDVKSAVDVLLSIVNNYSYSLIHYNTTYELHFLNTLELVCPKMERRSKDVILDWIRGSEGLRVIDSCIQSDSFLGYNQYRYVYQVIEVGLKSQFKADNIQAARIISKLLKYADWDDTFQIYERVHGIMIYLCKKIEKYCKDQQTFVFNLAMMHLLDTYDQAIFAYARTGAAYTAALLITSSVQSNKSEGLQILRIITNVSKVGIVIFLLENKDIIQTGLWQRFFESEDFFKNQNIEIRKNYYTILDSLLAHGEKEMIQNICMMYSNHFTDIFQVFTETLRHEDEDFIIERVLNSMKSILYYANQHNAMDYIIGSCTQKGLVRILEDISANRQNRLVVESANEILQVLSQNQNHNQFSEV